MKIRSLAVLYAGAVTSAGLAVNWPDGRVVGAFVLLVTIPWIGLYLIDRFYYHVLLQGAVLQASKIEVVLFAKTGLPSPSATLREFNHRFPVPWTRIKTGGQKVSTFYATPFVVAVFLGFSVYLETHLQLESSPLAWVNENWQGVAFLMAITMAASVVMTFVAIEQDQQRRLNQYSSETEE